MEKKKNTHAQPLKKRERSYTHTHTLADTFTKFFTLREKLLFTVPPPPARK